MYWNDIQERYKEYPNSGFGSGEEVQGVRFELAGGSGLWLGAWKCRSAACRAERLGLCKGVLFMGYTG